MCANSVPNFSDMEQSVAELLTINQHFRPFFSTGGAILDTLSRSWESDFLHQICIGGSRSHALPMRFSDFGPDALLYFATAGP